MAKKSAIQKTLKKKKLIAGNAKKRSTIKEQMAKAETFEERMLLQKQLESLPLNSSKIRHKNRCWLTGRPKGYHRDFGICRNALRKMAHEGLIPGLKKASW